jgi:hypothetical protein
LLVERQVSNPKPVGFEIEPGGGESIGSCMRPSLAPCAQFHFPMLGRMFALGRTFLGSSKTICIDSAHDDHDMRMMIAFVTFAVRCMPRYVGDIAFLDELRPHEFLRQGPALLGIKLVRKCQDVIARQLGVGAFFGLFDRVPELTPIPHPTRRAVGQKDFGGHDPALTSVVIDDPGTFVFQFSPGPIGSGRSRAFTGTIGCSTDRGPSTGAGNDLRFEAAESHD